MQLIQWNTLVALDLQPAHNRPITFGDVKGDEYSFIVLHGLRRDFDVLKTIVFVEVLNAFCAGSQEFLAIKTVADQPSPFFYLDLINQVAAAQVVISGKRNF